MAAATEKNSSCRLAEMIHGDGSVKFSSVLVILSGLLLFNGAFAGTKYIQSEPYGKKVLPLTLSFQAAICKRT